MKKLFTVFALFVVVAFLGVARLAAQNTQTQQPSHVLTDEDMQQRYHSDTNTTSDTDTSTTTDTNTASDKTDQTTDKTTTETGANDLEGLKQQLAKKQKELDGTKSGHNVLQILKESTQKKLDATTDDDYRTELQNQLDENAKDTAANEAQQKRLEKEVADLQDQIKDAETNGTGTTTTASKDQNSDQTDKNSNTENKPPEDNGKPQR